MTKFRIILLLLVLIAILTIATFHTTTIDSIESNENTLVISVCTNDMRGLETGISVYASINDYPLILSDSMIPDELSNYLDVFIRENNITKVVIAGDLDYSQIFKFKSMNLEVEKINGDSISEILTTLAENSDNISNDTVIFTSSDPIAAILGAYTKTPVFITATNSSYNSAETLDSEYDNYLESHDISNIIVVGNLPDSLIDQLSTYNATIEQLTGPTSSDVSIAVNDKLKSIGYLEDSTTAYYGFFGEIPSIIPNVVKDNAYLIEDSTGSSNVLDYLKMNNITDIIFTRNTESEYIQMEEQDYISSNITTMYEDNNFTVKYLTNKRTLDEATGLYDMKINTLKLSENHQENNNSTEKIGIFLYNNNYNRTTNDNRDDYNLINDNITRQLPPLLSLLSYPSWIDSNNISLSIIDNGNNLTAKWSTIHPYTWIKVNDTYYISKTNTGYDYVWSYDDSKWNVDYYYNNSSYYHVEFIQNNSDSWTEVEPHANYTWKYEYSTWNCYDNSSNLVYYIEKA